MSPVGANVGCEAEATAGSFTYGHTGLRFSTSGFRGIGMPRKNRKVQHRMFVSAVGKLVGELLETLPGLGSLALHRAWKIAVPERNAPEALLGRALGHFIFSPYWV